MLMFPLMTPFNLSCWDDCLEVLYDCVPVVVPVLASVSYAIEDAFRIMAVTSHDQKCHLAPYFDHLDLRNTMVPLITSSAFQNGIAYPKRSGCIGFQSSWSKECNGDIEDGIGIKWPKSCISFQLSLHQECSGANDDAIAITWWWHQCQWCYMMEKSCVTPHFNLDVRNSVVTFMMSLLLHDANSITWPKQHAAALSIILASGMQWGHWWCH